MIYLKTYKLTLPGPLPGLNEYINAERGNRYTAASMKVNIQSVIALNIRRQLHGLHIKNPLEGYPLVYRFPVCGQAPPQG